VNSNRDEGGSHGVFEGINHLSVALATNTLDVTNWGLTTEGIDVEVEGTAQSSVGSGISVVIQVDSAHIRHGGGLHGNSDSLTNPVAQIQ